MQPPGKAAHTTVKSGAEAAQRIAQNVEDIARIENHDREEMSTSDRLAHVITVFSGSMIYVWLHVGWFTAWIVLNAGIFGLPKFDRFPYGLLTMIVSLEAIFLSTFVLISQNRQALQADRRAKVDLQVNLISEQEITKLMEMVAAIHHQLGMDTRHDEELREMKEATSVQAVADAVAAAEREQERAAKAEQNDGSADNGADGRPKDDART